MTAATTPSRELSACRSSVSSKLPKGSISGTTAWEGDGRLVNSGPLNGLDAPQAKTAVIAWLEERGLGRSRVQYRLRDWLFSRQRYWGEPFPILHLVGRRHRAPAGGRVAAAGPGTRRLQADGSRRAAVGAGKRLGADARSGTGLPALRETNTMPQWAGSCWYYLRFADPDNRKALIDPEKEKYWLPVDLYVGGAEHAVLHLLYARFWHKVLYDIGVVSTKEPFQKLFNQGMILAFSYRDDSGKYYRPDEVIRTRRPVVCRRKAGQPADREDVEVEVQRRQSGRGDRHLRCRLHASL